jgi:uncharacterized coiled-coil DUF342 family protein
VTLPLWHDSCLQGKHGGRKSNEYPPGQQVTVTKKKSQVVATLIRELKEERDELKLKIHLGKMELQEEWQELDDKLDALNHRFDPLKDAVEETAEDVWDSLKLVASEIKDGFKRIRKSL